MQIDYLKLKGQFVYLEALQPSHLPLIKPLVKDERLWEFTNTLIINDSFDEQYDKYMAVALDPMGTGNQYSFVIRKTDNKDIIGMTRYYFHEPENKRVAIGYTWYVPEVWGEVYNKECKLLLLDYGFNELDLNRVEFHVAHRNVRSQKAVSKIGAKHEGILRNYAIQADGSIRHTYVFSIIKEEWPETRKHLVALMETVKAKEVNP
jgi:N-acetyltransferase